MSEAWHGLLRSEADTAALGAAVGRHARAGDVVALLGELGAGKTRLVAGIASGMGLDAAAVSSPTFVLVHEYDAPLGRPPLVHIDAYRIGSVEELESMGWERSGELQRGAVVAVEWADRVGAGWGDDVLTIQLTHAGDAARRVTIRVAGSWRARWPALRGELDCYGDAPAPACPICGKTVAADAATAPFCSARCRTIDLGKWLGGDYRITRPVEQRDVEEG